jgi:hypothetical protein
MNEEILWTIVFGLTATIIGLAALWQNSRLIELRRDSESILHAIRGRK